MSKEHLQIERPINNGVMSQNIILLSLAAALLIPTLGVSITNVALPALSHSFNAPLSAVNWVVIAYLVAVTSLVLGAGALSDKFGRKKMMLTGIVIFFGTSLLCALSTKVWILIFARFLQGAGAALILSSTIALAGTLLPKNKTGLAMGLMGTTAAIGTSLGPVLGGMTLAVLSWPFIFWLLAILAGLAFVLCSNGIPDEHVSTLNPKRFDSLGTILLTGTCLFYALAMTSSDLLITLTSVSFLALSFGLFTIFVYSQKKLSSPLIKLSILENKLRNRTLIASIFVNAIAMSTLVIGPYYLTYALGMSTATVGIIMSIGPFIAALSGYPSGKLVDKYSVNPILLLGLCLVILGTLSFAYLPVKFGLYGYIASLLVLSFGRQLFLASHHTFVMHSISDEDKGLASGVINLCKNFGLMTGASLMGGIFGFFLHVKHVSDATTQQLNAAFSTTFIISSIIVLLSLVSLFLTSKQKALSQ
ncbi:MFS transporter [Paraglaciecola arctica]|uniref:MFS transporter n=1 Tax=Paraglaciecola arctica TaxID=1128911 RepID=UPI00209114A5|nr:MFS transporter [Paraglaciecola arctica]